MNVAEEVSAEKKSSKKIATVVSAVVAVVVVLFIGGILTYQYWWLPRVEESNVALSKCEQLFLNGNYDKALNGDGQEVIGFLQVADKYHCTKAANLSHLYAAICYVQEDKFQEASSQLEDFSGCGDEMVSPSALGMLGNCYAELGQKEKAVETLLKAAKEADNNTLSPIFLVQAGQIYEDLGQNDKALECYQQVKDKYQQSYQYQEIDKFIERLSK